MQGGSNVVSMLGWCSTCRRKGRVSLRSRKVNSPREAIRFAIEHLSEREAAFGRREALVRGSARGRGAATSQAITAELDRQIGAGDLVQDTAGQWLTTRAAIEAEQRLLTIELQGRDAVPAIAMGVPRAEEGSVSRVSMPVSARSSSTSSRRAIGSSA